MGILNAVGLTRAATPNANVTGRWQPRGMVQRLRGPINVNDSTILTVTAAYRCVHLIADTIGSLPLVAVDAAGRRRDTQPAVTRELVADMTNVEAISSIVVSLLIHGNAYLIPTTYTAGWPRQFVIADPNAVTVRMIGGRYRYHVGGLELEADELLHIRGLTPPGSPLGVGVIEYQAATIARNIAANDYVGQRWMTGARPDDGVLETEFDLNKGEADDLRGDFVVAHGGRQRGPAVLPRGVTWKPTGFSDRELEMLESRKWNALEICSMFGVPAFLAQIPSGESKTYQNVNQDTAAFVRFTLRSWLSRLEAALTTQRPAPELLRFELDDLLRADRLERMQGHEIGIRSGVLLPNEARGVEGLEPLPDPPPAAGDEDQGDDELEEEGDGDE